MRQAATQGKLHRVTHPGEIDTVVDYLARYTHRIAITNARILAVEDTQVSLRYKDYRDGNRHKTICLDGEGSCAVFYFTYCPRA